MVSEISYHRINGYTVLEYNKKNIYIIEDVMNTTLCKAIIDMMNRSKMVKTEIKKGQNVECFVTNNDDSEGMYDILVKKLEEIFTIIGVLAPSTNVKSCSGYQLRKVYGKTHLHSDGVFDGVLSKTKDNKIIRGVRSITVVSVLNDDYDGGLYDFPYQDVQIRLKAGSVIFFPPYWTHPHRVSSVGENQYRYIFSTWGLQNMQEI